MGFIHLSLSIDVLSLAGHYNIFVGDLSPEVTDATLFAAFCMYPSCSDARVMWDQRSGRSRGFGFVSFRSQQEAEIAISEMTGKWLGSRPIRCNWATKSSMGPQADEVHTAGNGTGMSSAVDQMARYQAPLIQGVVIIHSFLFWQILQVDAVIISANSLCWLIFLIWLFASFH
jgi:RNA recognition motif-containing protein